MNQQPNIAVVGAGPAGLFASQELAKNGAHVVLFNRDIKPGGLAEYGIFFDKYKMKAGLRNQFRRLLENPSIDYIGNFTVGHNGNIRLEELCRLGFHAILITTGAQGTKWLGTAGEELQGVYHAKDLVYHFNQLPPYADKTFPIGKRVAIIGAGNVMIDIANWLIHYLKVDEVVSIVRRDASAVKFGKKEMQTVYNNLDQEAFAEEIDRIRLVMEGVGIDVEEAEKFIHSAEKRAYPAVSDSQFRFAFLASPKRIVGDGCGRVGGIELENTTLIVKEDGRTSAKGLGTTQTIPIDTVIYAVGDKVDDELGLPVSWNSYSCHPQPNFPVEGNSYEAFDPTSQTPIEGIFLAGWAREASNGLVGTARKDGIYGAKAIQHYLNAQMIESSNLDKIKSALCQFNPQLVHKCDWQRLDQFEMEQATLLNLPEYKFTSNNAMLHVINSV